MNVLSLFDGMSCGQIALERAGIKVTNYFASEIDKYAIRVTKSNYPNTIHIGDVTKVRYNNGILYTENGQYNVGKIDLVMGGSPCQGFSFAGKQLNFDDPRSVLFFEWLRICHEVCPYYFLLENVKMKKESEDVITDRLGVCPIEINSSLVSAGLRRRLYWTNIPGIEKPKDKHINLVDIIESGSVDRDKALCITRRYVGFAGSQDYLRYRYFGKSMGQAVFEGEATPDEHKVIYEKVQRDYSPEMKLNGTIRALTPIECERVQTVPENYTNVEGVSDNSRIEMLGNGWTVDVIAHIFEGLK